MEFNIGDKVLTPHGEGIICGIKKDSIAILVHHLNWTSGHKGGSLNPELGDLGSNSLCFNDSGYFYGQSELKLKEEESFNIGDLVSTPNGEGVISAVSSMSPPILVHHFTWRKGHNGQSSHIIMGSSSRCEEHSGYYYYENELSKLRVSGYSPMIVGHYYYGMNTIFQWQGVGKPIPRIINDTTFKTDRNDFWDKNSPEREATPKEKKWLDNCIQANTFVSKEIKFSAPNLDSVLEQGIVSYKEPLLNEQYIIKPVMIKCKLI